MFYNEQFHIGAREEFTFAQDSISSQRAVDLLTLVGNKQDLGNLKMAKKVVNRLLPASTEANSDPHSFSANLVEILFSHRA